MYYSPEEYIGSKFVADFTNSTFIYDLIDKKIEFERHPILYHCKSCEKLGYTFVKKGCFGGGRYCALDKSSEVTSEKILYQDIYNICVEKELENTKDGVMQLMRYYSLFFNHCAKYMDLKCTGSLLENMGIYDKVSTCMKNSIALPTDLASETKRKPNIFLDDNKILSKEKEIFNKVQNFNRFPMIKINGVIYYGQIDIANVFGFICQHVKDDLSGCGKFIKYVGSASHSRIFTSIVIIIVALMVCIVLNYCKKRLRERFDNELNYQVDASINKFLEKTGGDSL